MICNVMMENAQSCTAIPYYSETVWYGRVGLALLLSRRWFFLESTGEDDCQPREAAMGKKQNTACEGHSD